MAPAGGSVDLWFCVERAQKGTMASVHLSERKLSPSFYIDARHFSFSLYATGAFQAATPVLALRGSESE